MPITPRNSTPSTISTIHPKATSHLRYSAAVAGRNIRPYHNRKDPNYKEYGYPVIAPFDEIMTKLAERLVTAYLDKSLANNPDGIAKTIEAAANETNEILKKAGLYAECK